MCNFDSRPNRSGQIPPEVPGRGQCSEGSVLGSNASHRHPCLIQRTVSLFAHAGNIGTSYCSVSHIHKAQGYPHLFLVKNVFYRDICIEIFSYVSSCGMPSTCIALAAAPYFLLYPEDYLPLSLSYRTHINKPSLPVFFLTSSLIHEV